MIPKPCWERLSRAFSNVASVPLEFPLDNERRGRVCGLSKYIAMYSGKECFTFASDFLRRLCSVDEPPSPTVKEALTTLLFNLLSGEIIEGDIPRGGAEVIASLVPVRGRTRAGDIVYLFKPSEDELEDVEIEPPYQLLPRLKELVKFDVERRVVRVGKWWARLTDEGFLNAIDLIDPSSQLEAVVLKEHIPEEYRSLVGRRVKASTVLPVDGMWDGVFSTWVAWDGKVLVSILYKSEMAIVRRAFKVPLSDLGEKFKEEIDRLAEDLTSTRPLVEELYEYGKRNKYAVLLEEGEMPTFIVTGSRKTGMFVVVGRSGYRVTLFFSVPYQLPSILLRSVGGRFTSGSVYAIDVEDVRSIEEAEYLWEEYREKINKILYDYRGGSRGFMEVKDALALYLAAFAGVLSPAKEWKKVEATLDAFLHFLDYGSADKLLSGPDPFSNNAERIIALIRSSGFIVPCGSSVCLPGTPIEGILDLPPDDVEKIVEAVEKVGG